jgi:xylan 1,4-beta-xylosidase
MIIAAVPLTQADSPVTLRVEVDGLQRRFSFREGDDPFTELGQIPDCAFLSDEFLANGTKRHTGAMVGLYANNGGCGSRIPADFDFFKYEAFPV